MEDRPILRKLYDDFQNGRSFDEFIESADEFEKLMSYYWCAVREVETKFRVLDNQLSLGKKRNPIESIKTRLKSFQSIQGKLQKLEQPLSCNSIENNLNDVAGIRVICSYVDDIYMLADCFLRQDDITLLQKKDYIENPKPNGYRSLHLIIEIPVFLAEETRMVKVEVQLRTIAMETWANLEHNMRYKKQLPQEMLSKISDMLNECAAMSHSLDIKMQEIHDIIENEQ
ncbi:MAG: GTP pyrophosphokinase family protein [Clostridia bacterium]|nr:GTP pyrophosphokinase family protein [Clostridia bacterium]